MLTVALSCESHHIGPRRPISILAWHRLPSEQGVEQTGGSDSGELESGYGGPAHYAVPRCRVDGAWTVLEYARGLSGRSGRAEPLALIAAPARTGPDSAR